MAEPRWGRFAKAAVRQTPGTDTPGQRPGRRKRRGGLAAWVSVQWAERRERHARADQRASGPGRRADLRLLPAVAVVWAAAVAAVRAPWQVSLSAGLGLFVAGGLLAALLLLNRAPRRHSNPGFAVCLVLAILCAGAVLASAGFVLATQARAPISGPIRNSETITATLRLEQTPRPLSGSGPGHPGSGPQRVIFEAVITSGSAHGRIFEADSSVLVVAGQNWSALDEGDVVSTAGKLSPVGAGTKISAYFTPATAPALDRAASAGNKGALHAIRDAWIRAAKRAWQPVAPAVAGLLPGMVMGERSGIPPDLDDAMKVVGLTHLTAVSGENCTLILTGLIVMARTVRAPRAAAGLAGVLGLVGFVLVVGPDPSVLRAALMGAIGCAAMLGGRPKRTGTLLSLSILVLLIVDPWLGTDFAFVLSVLATFGLLVLGRPCAAWLQSWLPWWLAQAMAIPLAAQLFCGPVIVLLQPRLTVFAVPANMAVAPVIALVTGAGTLGMVAAPLVPGLAQVCAYAAGAGAWWVAVSGSWLAQLPGAVLPWPAGPIGVTLMALGNAAILAGLWACVNRRKISSMAGRVAAAATLRRLPVPGFPLLAACAAAVAGVWTWSVMSP
jgi:competence protein ComEC